MTRRSHTYVPPERDRAAVYAQILSKPRSTSGSCPWASLDHAYVYTDGAACYQPPA